MEVLTGKALSLSKKLFAYKCKLSLGLALLYLVDLFISKLKTKFNNLFYRIQKEFTTPFEEISPQELNKCLQKFYLSARKSDDRGRSVIARQNCNRCRQQ